MNINQNNFPEHLSGLLMQLLESNISSSPKEELIKAAAKNDVEKIQRLLNNDSVQVTWRRVCIFVKNP